MLQHKKLSETRDSIPKRWSFIFNALQLSTVSFTSESVGVEVKYVSDEWIKTYVGNFVMR